MKLWAHHSAGLGAGSLGTAAQNRRAHAKGKGRRLKFSDAAIAEFKRDAKVMTIKAAAKLHGIEYGYACNIMAGITRADVEPAA